jgi:hypothetical protein
VNLRKLFPVVAIVLVFWTEPTTAQDSREDLISAVRSELGDPLALSLSLSALPPAPARALVDLASGFTSGVPVSFPNKFRSGARQNLAAAQDQDSGAGRSFWRRIPWKWVGIGAAAVGIGWAIAAGGDEGDSGERGTISVPWPSGG